MLQANLHSFLGEEYFDFCILRALRGQPVFLARRRSSRASGRRRQPARMKPGLCASCQNVRIIENKRGSKFFLCELSKTDPRFPRYPRLPVVACDGYHPRIAKGPENDIG